MTRTQQKNLEALEKARNGHSTRSYAIILDGFSEKGIPVEDIRPRDNVLTYRAWKALGRHVRKGEHGIKVPTMIENTMREQDDSGETVERTYTRPWMTTVFHISQTEPNS